MVNDLQSMSKCTEQEEWKKCSNQDLRFNNFENKNLSTVDFSASDLRFAVFKDAKLKYTSFKQADVSGADFRGAELYSTNFLGATGLESVTYDDKTIFDGVRMPNNVLCEDNDIQCIITNTAANICEANQDCTHKSLGMCTCPRNKVCTAAKTCGTDTPVQPGTPGTQPRVPVQGRKEGNQKCYIYNGNQQRTTGFNVQNHFGICCRKDAFDRNDMVTDIYDTNLCANSCKMQ